VATATWTNTIGDPELSAVWKDPDFDPSVRKFYHARVVENPTPRNPIDPCRTDPRPLADVDRRQ